MNEEILEKAFERFDTAISSFEQKQAGQLGDLRERLEDVEARSVTGLSSSGGKERELKQIGGFMKTGEGLRQAKNITSSTPSSNAMIPESIAPDIWTFAKDSSSLLEHVRVTPTQSPNYSRILRTTPPGTAWVAETATRAATDDPSFRRRVPTSGEVHTLTTITSHVLEDNAVNLAQFLIEDVGLQMGRELDSVIISGSGTSRPTGILNTAPVATDDWASPLRSAEAIEYIEWFMNSQTLGEIRRAKTSQGDYL